MSIRFFVFVFLFTSGCTNVPQVPNSREALAKEEIKINKIEAKQAQDDYIKLQGQRRRK